MNNKSNVSFWYREWQILLVVLFFIFACICHYSRKQSDWQQLPFRERWRIRQNAEMWRNMDKDQQKAWPENQRRFQKFSRETKEFTRLLCHNWLCLPLKEREHRLRIYKLLKNLPKQEISEIQHNAIFMACLSLEKKLFISTEFLQGWNNFYLTLSSLDPLELRSYIYLHFHIFQMWDKLSPRMQKIWKQLSAKGRLELLQRIQKKNQGYSMRAWLPILRHMENIPPEIDPDSNK